LTQINCPSVKELASVKAANDEQSSKFTPELNS